MLLFIYFWLHLITYGTSLTRDWTHAPCGGSVESWPLDHQRIPMCLVTQSCPKLCDPMDCSPRGSSVHGDSLDKNYRVGCHALQGIFLTQVSNPGLPHCRWSLYCLSHHRSPILNFKHINKRHWLLNWISKTRPNTILSERRRWIKVKESDVPGKQ